MALRLCCNSSVKLDSGTSSDTGKMATVFRLATVGRTSLLGWSVKTICISGSVYTHILVLRYSFNLRIVSHKTETF